jgi:diguanylate cyclase (GGDEF)-like protein
MIVQFEMTMTGSLPAGADRLQELAILNEMVKALTSTLELPELLRNVLARIKTLTYAEAISLLLYDEQRDELVFAATETLREQMTEGLQESPQRSLATWVMRNGRSAMVNDVATDLRCSGTTETMPQCGARHLLAVPLLSEGGVIGVVELADRYDGLPFDEKDVAAIEDLVAKAGGQDPDRLSRDGAAVRSLLASAATAVPSQGATLMLFDAEGRGLRFSASRRLQPGVIDGLRMSTKCGIAGWVARHRQMVRLDDASKDPRYDPTVESETKFHPKGMLCVPIIIKDKLLGVIQVLNRLDGKSFDDDEVRLVQTLADHAAIAIENASLYRKAEIASLTDDLTGLGNTRHLNRLLPELIQRGRPLSLLVLDFDNFKEVVDRYGHLAGAQTIAHIGRLIGHLIRPGDFAARFGGDEFVVVMPDADAAAALTAAESLRSAIESCQRVDGLDIDVSAVTASVGVATFPDHASTADGLLSAADAAMYAVKRSGKNGVRRAESVLDS